MSTAVLLAACGSTAETVAAQDVITVSIGTCQRQREGVPTGRRLPADATNLGTISSGDLMLYGSDTVVLFYESFDTSYAYTRIGRLDAPNRLAGVLGAGDITVTFTHP